MSTESTTDLSKKVNLGVALLFLTVAALSYALLGSRWVGEGSPFRGGLVSFAGFSCIGGEALFLAVLGRRIRVPVIGLVAALSSFLHLYWLSFALSGVTILSIGVPWLLDVGASRRRRKTSKSS